MRINFGLNDCRVESLISAIDPSLRPNFGLSDRSVQTKQDAQILQRDRAAVCVIVLAKSGRLELRDNILRTL